LKPPTSLGCAKPTNILKLSERSQPTPRDIKLWMIYDDLKSVDVHFPKCGISMDFIDLLCL